jgi:hypothetical protein
MPAQTLRFYTFCLYLQYTGRAGKALFVRKMAAHCNQFAPSLACALLTGRKHFLFLSREKIFKGAKGDLNKIRPKIWPNWKYRKQGAYATVQG